jgi:uncharacterized membrane protein
MGLEFQNQYHSTIWIALVYGNRNCASGFRKQGWWGVSPGQTRNIWNVNLQSVNRFAAFYAEEFKGGGGVTWNGTGNMWYLIRDGVFDQCYEDNTGCNQQPNFVGLDFDQADNGHYDFYGLRITLGPSPGQIRTTGSVLIDHGALSASSA